MPCEFLQLFTNRSEKELRLVALPYGDEYCLEIFENNETSELKPFVFSSQTLLSYARAVIRKEGVELIEIVEDECCDLDENAIRKIEETLVDLEKANEFNALFNSMKSSGLTIERIRFRCTEDDETRFDFFFQINGLIGIPANKSKFLLDLIGIELFK